MKLYLLAFLLVGSLHADALINFDSISAGTVAPISVTSTGVDPLVVTFSPTSNGTFAQIYSAATWLPVSGPLLTGNLLGANQGLIITFSQDVSGLAFDFGVPGFGPVQELEIELFENDSPAGSSFVPTTAFVSIPIGITTAVGSTSVTSDRAFNKVLLFDPNQVLRLHCAITSV